MQFNNATSKAERKKLTTMMHPELSDALKKEAIDRKVSVADILEELAIDYLRKSKSPSKDKLS